MKINIKHEKVLKLAQSFHNEEMSDIIIKAISENRISLVLW